MRLIFLVILTNFLFAIDFKNIEGGFVYSKNYKSGVEVDLKSVSLNENLKSMLEVRGYMFEKKSYLNMNGFFDYKYKFLKSGIVTELLDDGYFFFLPYIALEKEIGFFKGEGRFFYKYLVDKDSYEYDVRGYMISLIMNNENLYTNLFYKKSFANSRDNLGNFSLKEIGANLLVNIYTLSLGVNYSYTTSSNSEELNYLNSFIKIPFRKIYYKLGIKKFSDELISYLLVGYRF